MLDGKKCFEKGHIIKKTTLPESLLTANKMLGSGINDLIPRPIIICERSVEFLLTRLSEKLGYSLPTFIATESGDDPIRQRLDSALKFAKTLKIVSSKWPEREYLDIQYIAVMDDDKQRDVLIKKYGKEGFVEVYSLGVSCLEDSYPIDWVNQFFHSKFPDVKTAWDHSTKINRYIRDVLGENDHEQIGILKRDLAEHVVGKINASNIKKVLPRVEKLFKDWKDGYLVL